MSGHKHFSIKDIDTTKIKRIITEFSSPIIPLTYIFENLGYAGLTGLGWALLAGATTAVAIECGYAVRKVGHMIVLEQQKSNREVKSSKEVKM